MSPQTVAPVCVGSQMPWVVRGQAGIAVRWVKDFISGQWLCTQLGAEGSGCGHTLNPNQEVPSHQAHQKKRSRKETDWLAETRGGTRKSGSRDLPDGKGGAPSKHKTHSLKAKKTMKGQEAGQEMSQGMVKVTPFWSQAADVSIASSDEGSHFLSCTSAFQLGGSLRYLKPMFLNVAQRRAAKGDEVQDSVKTTVGVPREALTDVPSEATHSSGRRRRGVRGAQKTSALLTVSVRTTDANEDSTASPPFQRSSPESLKNDEEDLKPAVGINSNQQRPLSSAPPNQPGLRQVAGQAPFARNPESASRAGDRKKTGGAAGPRSRAPQAGGSGAPSKSAPVQGVAVKEKRPFQILNPLEVVAGFVEEVQDIVYAVTGKKRAPSGESVAAWEEKALAKSLLRKKHASLVMFYSKKCQLCKSMTPMVNDMAQKESWWLDVCYVDVDNQSWMPEVVHYDISYVPCFMYLTPSGMAMAKTGAPLSKTHVLDGLQKVMSGAHPECKLARRRLADKVRMRQQEAYAKARADWEAQKKQSGKESSSEEAAENKA